MKKTILTLIAGVAVAGSAFAQGTIAVSSTSSTYSIFTSGTAYNSSLNGVYSTAETKTATTANGFYYALLFQPYNAGLTAINPLDSNYALGMMATNSATTTGGIRGQGGTSGAPITGWAAPTDANYNTAEQNNFLVVGWSASLGSTWAAVSAQLQSGNWNAPGFFGVSALGNAYAGGGPNSLPVVNVFGVTVGAPGGLTQGLTLYTVTPAAVPEPSTMVLAGLGGLSLLAFRRKK